MSMRPLALIIDPDVGFLHHAASSLQKAGYQVRERRSPEGLREFTGALRPELILLGSPFWERGWAQVFRSYSPESVVFPVAPYSDSPGVADLRRLPVLLSRPRHRAPRSEEEHAA